MKNKLFILTVLALAAWGQVSAKGSARTAEDYKAMIDQHSGQIYGIYYLNDANVNTVVDRSGKVLSMEFLSSTYGTQVRGLLLPKGDRVTLTIEQTEEEDPEQKSLTTCIFDPLLRIESCEINMVSPGTDNQRVHYTTYYTYEKDGRESTSIRHRFIVGLRSDSPVFELAMIPGYGPTEVADGEGLIAEYAPELGYKECCGITLLDSDGKPKMAPQGFSSIRLTHQPLPGYNIYWRADNAIDELRAIALQNTVSDEEGADYYVAKTELFDEKGKPVNSTDGIAQVVLEMYEAENGDQVLTQTYLDKQGRPADFQFDGAAFSKIEYICSDSVEMASLYHADGTPAESPAGIARYYSKSSDSEQIVYWADRNGKYVVVKDADGDPVTGYGCRMQRTYRDSEGRHVRQTSYYGTDESDRVNGNDGYSEEIVYMNPDDEYQTYSENYFGTDGKPVVNSELGYAAKRYTYNDNDVVTEIAYYGADLKPIEVRGIAREVYGFRSKYYTYSPDFTWYYNAAGEMITPDNMPVDPEQDEPAEYVVLDEE